MEVKIYIPHPALREFVLNISTVDVRLPNGTQEVVTPYPPAPFQSLMFYCNDPISSNQTGDGIFHLQPLSLLTGPQVSRVNVKVHATLRSVRVDFLPGGLYRLLGIPMHELFDGGFDASDFFGPEMKRINERLRHVPNLVEGKDLVEKFLLDHLDNLKSLLPFDRAMGHFLRHHEQMSIEKLASLSCLGIKQFERKCQERIGMNPKMYARILRFSKAYRLREAFPDISWTEIAYRAGYYDQMHMIRDFKVFAGVNPSIIQQELFATPLRMQRHLRY